MSQLPDGQTNLPWQPRFGLGSLLLVLLVCAVTAAGGRYLLQTLQQGQALRARFVLFVIALPVLFLVVVSGLRLAIVGLNRRR